MFITKQKPKLKRKILVIGFYNRNNIGDDSYTATIPKIFKDFTCIFQCSDDILCITSDIDIVIVGGGDVINKYFMSKIYNLLKNFTGPVYAFSVGIPYVSSGVEYLDIFDHIFTRDRTNYEFVKNNVGSANVTYLPDVSLSLSPYVDYSLFKSKKYKIGIALAQPMFYKNKNNNLLDNFCKVLCKLPSNIEYHIVAFNYSNELSESDAILNMNLFIKLRALNINVYNDADITTVDKMLKAINGMDLMLCSRYHSIMFSIIQGKKCVPIYISRKVDNLLKDLSTPISYSYKLPADEHDMPIDLNVETLYANLNAAIKDTSSPPELSINKDYSTIVKYAVKLVTINKKKNIIIKNDYDSLDHVLYKCCKILTHYFKMTTSTYNKMLYEKKPLIINDLDPFNVARLISYIITGFVQNEYVWGLAHNIYKEDFCLYDTINYIWKDAKKTADAFTLASEHYYPTITIPRKIFINLDFIFQNSFSGYHRSGWAYAIGGLMNIDGHHFDRASNILLDTYIDRSFHWGMETLRTIGILPYKTPWIGFIHHTFDETHSTYNCVELFKNSTFIQSLNTCKSLIVLTEYLQKQIVEALHKVNIYTVPVNVVYHPMEFVPNLFTMKKFNKNKNKKVIQIGAWLRNPYAIYEMPLDDEWMNPLGIRKYALRGKDMDQYFKPNNFLEDLSECIFKEYSNTNNTGSMCRNEPISKICRTNAINKYCTGLYDSIVQNDKSVIIIEKLNNDEYDTLLSENIVFLNLIDCSAVNTVLEILVRNTPLLVNRHPAVEEILGVNYPGFYINLTHAIFILSNVKKITEITNYIQALDKSKYTLDNFVDKVQKVCL